MIISNSYNKFLYLQNMSIGISYNGTFIWEYKRKKERKTDWDANFTRVFILSWVYILFNHFYNSVILINVEHFLVSFDMYLYRSRGGMFRVKQPISERKKCANICVKISSRNSIILSVFMLLSRNRHLFLGGLLLLNLFEIADNESWIALQIWKDENSIQSKKFCPSSLVKNTFLIN